MPGPVRLDSKLLGSSWRVKFFEDTISVNSMSHKFARFEAPDFALAVASTRDGKVPLVKQYRNGAAESIWEFPAGFLEDGETPRECVKREFREEVGHALEKIRLVASVYISPGRTNQRAHLFTGHVGAKSTQNLDESEAMEVEFVSRREALRRLKEKGSASSAHLLAYFLKFSQI